MLVSSEPAGKPCAERLRKEKNGQSPHARCDAGDGQEAYQRDAQKARGEIRGQPCAGNQPAEKQYRSSALGKPAFTRANPCAEATERGSLEPSTSGVASESIKSGIAHPDAEEARNKRRYPGDSA